MISAEQSTTATNSTAALTPVDLRFRREWQWFTLAFLSVSTAIRACQLCATELVPDEAYYWDWSRRPSLGYYDQGPFVAYLIRATTAIFGATEFGVRIGVLLASLGTLILVYRLGARCFSPMAGCLSVIILGCTPLMEVGSIIATYDPPLVFFYTLSMAALYGCLFEKADSGRSCWAAWIGAGVATGFGFLSKHTMLVIAPSLVLFLALSPAHRFWLRRPQPYVAFLITLFMYSGVFWWNAHHHWWTFGHLLFLTHGKSAHSEALKHIGDFAGSQALLLGPVLFLCLLGDLKRMAPFLTKPPNLHSSFESQSPPTLQRLFFFCMGWPSIVLFVALAAKTKVQGNWAAFAWTAPVMLLSERLSEKLISASNHQRRMAHALVGALAATGLALTTMMVYPQWLYRLGLHVKPDNDLTNQYLGWRETAARVDAVRHEMSEGGRKPVFIVGSGYQYCALLAFYLPDHPRTYDMFLHYRLDMYAAYVQELTAKMGEDAVFINDNMVEDADLRKVFTEVTWDPPMPIYRRPYYKDPIRTVHIARCRGYRLYTGTNWHVGG